MSKTTYSFYRRLSAGFQHLEDRQLLSIGGAAADSSGDANIAAVTSSMASHAETALISPAVSTATASDSPIAAGASIVHINTAWLSAQGTGPYLLTSSDTNYILDTDVTVNGTAFVFGGKNITLDLNGHTVTYGNYAPLTVANGGFETGTVGSRTVTGWDLTSAPHAAIAANASPYNLFDGKMLLFTNAGTESILSNSITIPTVGHSYTATVTPSQAPDIDNGTALTLSIVDAATGAVLASGTSSNAGRGMSAVVNYTPTTTAPVKLKITVKPLPGNNAISMAIDNATMTYSNDYGVYAGWPHLPPQLNTAAVINACHATGYAGQNPPANAVVKNGTIRQGKAGGYASYPIYISDISGVTVDGVTTYSSGVDTASVNARSSGDVTIRNSTFNSTATNVTNRMSMVGAMINIGDQIGNTVVENNTLNGSPQIGIYASMNDPGGTKNLVIRGNTIHSNAMATDCYGILTSGVHNFEISGNKIESLPNGSGGYKSGRGILIDGTDGYSNRNGEVFNNYVDIRENGNREFAYTGLEATALRMRAHYGYQNTNIHVHDNTFIARTGAGGDWEAIGGRIYDSNSSNSGVVIENNLFKAIVDTTDSSYAARAFSFEGIAANTNFVMRNNVFESNDISLGFSGNDGNDENDGLFISNVIRKNTVDGAARPYKPITAGYWTGQVHNVRLIDTRYENGANSTITWIGSGTKDITIGRPMTVQSKTPAGAALPGATVQVFDANNVSIFTGTTDANGMLTAPVGSITYRQTGADPKVITTTGSQGTFTIRFSKDGYTSSITVSANNNVWNAVGIGDFNADGTDDVLVRDQTTGEIGIWTVRNGQYTGYTKIGVSDPATWSVAGVADFNGDGTDDILMRNTNPVNGGIGVWIVQNSKLVRWSSIGAADPTLWDVDGVGDFNRDGTADILLHNRQTGGVGIWMVKNGSYSRWSSVGNAKSAADWEVCGAGDFNRDGTADVLLRNRMTGEIGAWIIQNGSYSSWVSIGTAANWNVAGILDANGDGTSDILLRNATTGDVNVWTVSNGKLNASQNLGKADLNSLDVVGTGKLFGGTTDGVVLRNRNTQEVNYWRLNNGSFTSSNVVSTLTAFLGPSTGTGAMKSDAPAMQAATVKNVDSTAAATNGKIASDATRFSIGGGLASKVFDSVFAAEDDLAALAKSPKVKILASEISQETSVSKEQKVHANLLPAGVPSSEIVAGSAKENGSQNKNKANSGLKKGVIDKSIEEDLLDAIKGGTHDFVDAVDCVFRNEAILNRKAAISSNR